MNWLKEAEKELKNQSKRLLATENIKMRLDALSKLPINDENNEKKILLYNQLEALYKLTELCERALSSMSEIERDILKEFYIYPHKDHIDYICTVHAIEKSTVYRIKANALKNFSNIMFGSC